LGSEGADVRGRLVYRVTEPRQGGLTPRRHDMGDVHPVVHPDVSDVCDVRSTTATSAGSRRGEGDRSYCPIPGAMGSTLQCGGEFQNATNFSYGTKHSNIY
jgi:hypothetical protein